VQRGKGGVDIRVRGMYAFLVKLGLSTLILCPNICHVVLRLTLLNAGGVLRTEIMVGLWVLN
jgi:hypothetical protein